MDKLNFDFEPFSEQLVRGYQDSHKEDTAKISPKVAETVDKTLTEWNRVEAPLLNSVGELATYEIQRRVNLEERLNADLGTIASEGFVKYAALKVNLAVQQATTQLAFQNYLVEFLFDARGEPREAAKKILEENSESEAFREMIATADHSFCCDFQLDETLRIRTKQIVNTYQRAFMQFDFKHLFARYRDIGSQVLVELDLGY